MTLVSYHLSYYFIYLYFEFVLIILFVSRKVSRLFRPFSSTNLEETKWASLRDFCEEKAADGLLRYYFEHGQEYVQIGGTARGFETGFSKKRTGLKNYRCQLSV